MGRTVSKISGIFIPVTDMKRSTEWYVKAFELEVIQISDGCTGLAFPGEATFINLWKVARPQPTTFDAGGYTIPYYNFESFDIERSHAALVALGAEVTPIRDDDGIRHFDCFDPDGNELGIVEELPGSEAFYAHKQKYR